MEFCGSLEPEISVDELDAKADKPETINGRFRFPFNELLIGCFLLSIFLIKGFHAFILIFLCGALALELVLVLTNQKICNTRDCGSSTGAWLLVPLPAILANYDTDTALNLISSSFLALVICCFLRKPTKISYVSFFIWITCACFARQSFTLDFTLTFLFITFLLAELLSNYSATLTICEADLIAQICLIFNVNTVLFIIPFLCIYTIGRFKMSPSRDSLATLSILTIWLITLAGDFADHLVIQEDFIDPPLLININPLKFVIDLVTPVNIILVATLWVPLSILAILIVVFFNIDDNARTKSTFVLRKMFHFLAGIVFSAGLLVSPQFLSVAASAVLLAFLAVEWYRRRGPPYISKTLDEFLKPFRDSRDSGDLIFTPIALLLGLSLPVWDFGFEHGVSPRTWSGVITIAVGDSVAALVGHRWGHYFFHWPGTHRTIIGSAASFLSQMLLWALLAVFYGWSWRTGLLPLGMGVLAEAYTEQIDNLAIPLLVMSLIPSAP